jgi:acyl carrier protein
MRSIDDFVLSTIAEICNLEPAVLAPTTSLAEIGFDSLTAVSFVSAVETVYGLQLDNDALVELFGTTRLAEVIAFVARVLEDAPAATPAIALG